jgi:hypothetical protein
MQHERRHQIGRSDIHLTPAALDTVRPLDNAAEQCGVIKEATRIESLNSLSLLEKMLEASGVSGTRKNP